MLSVKQRFDSASETYDSVATVQKICAQTLCSLLVSRHADVSFQSILDLGAGTGYMTEALLPHFSESQFVLSDHSKNMLSFAQKKFHAHSNIQYQHADFMTDFLNFHSLIVSNLALQWADNLQEIIAKHFDNTDLFAFSCLLNGTFNGWYQLLKTYDSGYRAKQYPEDFELISFLNSLPQAALFTEVREYCLIFENAYAVLRYLKELGASQNDSAVSLPMLRSLMRSKQPIDLTYRVLYVVMEKI